MNSDTPPNVLPFERGPQADEAARAWVARIDAGPLLPEERQQLHAWLNADASHRRLLDEHALLWATAGRANFPAGQGASMGAGRPVRPPASARPMWLGALGAAAAIATVASIWLGLPTRLLSGGQTQDQVLATAVGERRPVNLPDGSRTELNAASVLRVAYRPDHRRVVLERGEGLFDVAKDKARPFEVVAGDTTVRAVGTRFLVSRRGDGRVEVTVYEGVVEVTKAGVSQQMAATSGGSVGATPRQEPQPLRLGAGQTAVSRAEQTVVAVAEPQAMERKLAWQSGRLEFDRTPLADAVEEVNRYSPQPVRLNDAALGSMQVSGSFSTQDTGVFIRSLERGFGLRVQRAGDAWVVSK